MGHNHHYSYNPFAVRRLKVFLRANWIILIAILLVLSLGSLWVFSNLTPVPTNLLYGEPGLVNPGNLDGNLNGIALMPNNVANMTLLPLVMNQMVPPTQMGAGFISPAIDPQGVLCPVTSQVGNGDKRIDLYNLETEQTIFLATFTQGSIGRLIYRPVKNEILVANIGAEDTLRGRLAKSSLFASLALGGEVKTGINRFDAETGEFLNRLELPVPFIFSDVSPDGRHLLAIIPSWISLSRGWLILIDLETGNFERLPLIAEHCYFESNDAILVLQKDYVMRFNLKEPQVEKLFHYPQDSWQNPPHVTSSLRDADHIYFSLQDSASAYYGSITLGDQTTMEINKIPQVSSLTLGLNASLSFQPTRGIAIGIEQSDVTSLVVYDLKSGTVIKRLPQPLGWAGFIGKDYVVLNVGSKSYIVNIDEFLDASFEFEDKEGDK